MINSRSSIESEKKLDADHVCEKIKQSANKALAFFEKKLEENGSYGSAITDLSCYYKSPMMFISAGKPEVSEKVLSYIASKFMAENGDFRTSENLKSIKPEYVEYWSYINGWILRAANELKISRVSQPVQTYLKSYAVGKEGGFFTNNTINSTDVTDILTTAHHGLINLEVGNLDVAIAAGNYLCNAINQQPDIQKGFYLRFNTKGAPIVEFSKENTPFYFISREQPNQLHFMIGYPSAYLAMLYKKTDNKKFLEAAQGYLNFSLSCEKSVYECNFSHKLAWAASILYEITGDSKYLLIIEKIANHFMSTQSSSGVWYEDDTNASFDQSAEIACWFFDIVKNINKFKQTLEDSKKHLGDAVSPDEVENKKSWAHKAIKGGVTMLVAGLSLFVVYNAVKKSGAITKDFNPSNSHSPK